MVSTRSTSGTPPPSSKILVKFKKPEVLQEKKGVLKTHTMRTKSIAQKKKNGSSGVDEASGSRKRVVDVKIEHRGSTLLVLVFPLFCFSCFVVVYVLSAQIRLLDVMFLF